MVGELEFEKPVLELRQKITDLKEFTKNTDVDLTAEIEKLEVTTSQARKRNIRKY